MAQLTSNFFLRVDVSKKQKQWITVKVSDLEMTALEAYCQQTERTKTDVIRELLRKIPTYTNIATSNNSLTE